MAAYTLRSNLEWLDFPDCAGLNEYGRCRYLDVPVCRGKACSLYKTRENDEASAEFAKTRLSSHDEETQKRIAKKYYHGKRPWLDGR